MASKLDVGLLASQVDTPESRKRGPPVQNPGLSFWQQTTRAFQHLESNKHNSIPSTSPYVVIGSGIAGGLLTYELIQAGVPGKDIILLEAREAASGASSRNAGHVRPGKHTPHTFYADFTCADMFQTLSEGSRPTHNITARSKPSRFLQTSGSF